MTPRDAVERAYRALMPDWHTFALFVAGSMALIASPGADFAFVLSRALAGGRRAGVAAALGIGTGLLVHTAVAAGGLVAVLRASPVAFQALRWAGAAYLVYLGARTLASRAAFESGRAGEAAATPARLGAVYRRGVLTNVLNPKVALTFGAFLPQFLPPTASGGASAAGVAGLGLAICAMAVAWFSVVGVASGALRRHVVGNRVVAGVARWGTGSLLIAFGVRLAWGRVGGGGGD